MADAPGEPLLVWYGGGHAAKVPAGEWVTMGCHILREQASPPLDARSRSGAATGGPRRRC